jgi:flagella basal body P-ring formation protein FlgA
MRHRLGCVGAALAALLTLATARPAAAADMVVPVPTIVLYPGDVIRDGVLKDESLSMDAAIASEVVVDRAQLVGKIARRTLLPGRPIPMIGVATPKVVANGAQVKLVFQEGGLTITTYAAALQAGGVGDLIKVRNPESGIVVTGTVQPDGSVRVSDS